MYDDYDRIDARIRMAFRDIYVPPPRIPRKQWGAARALLTILAVYGGSWLLLVGCVYFVVKR